MNSSSRSQNFKLNWQVFVLWRRWGPSYSVHVIRNCNFPASNEVEFLNLLQLETLHLISPTSKSPPVTWYPPTLSSMRFKVRITALVYTSITKNICPHIPALETIVKASYQTGGRDIDYTDSLQVVCCQTHLNVTLLGSTTQSCMKRPW